MARTTQNEDTRIHSNSERMVYDLADKVREYSVGEQSNGASAQQTLAYMLFVAHSMDKLPEGVNMAHAYQETSREAQTTRNNLILANMFGVLEVNDKTGKYNVVEGEDPAVIASIKTRINRCLSIVAWFIKYADDNNVVADDFVGLTEDGILTVTGGVYYPEEKVAGNERLAGNWLELDSRTKNGGGTFKALMERADKGLGYERPKRGSRGANDSGITVKAGNVRKVVDALASYIDSKDSDDFNEDTRNELAALADRIANLLKTSSDAKSTKSTKTAKSAKAA